MSAGADGIRVACNSCNGEFRVKAKAIGRKVKCPRCGRETLVLEISSPPNIESEPTPPDTSDDDPFGFLQDVNQAPHAGIPPLAPQINLSNVEYSKTKPKSPEFKPRRYGALEIARMLHYTFAGLTFLGWACYSLILFLTLVGVFASEPQTAEWPSDVPKGTSMFALDLTDEQREAIVKFEQANRIQPASNSLVAGFGIPTWIVVTIPSFISIVLFCSYAELIKVAVNIQENTQRTAHYAFFGR